MEFQIFIMTDFSKPGKKIFETGASSLAFGLGMATEPVYCFTVHCFLFSERKTTRTETKQTEINKGKNSSQSSTLDISSIPARPPPASTSPVFRHGPASPGGCRTIRLRIMRSSCDPPLSPLFASKALAAMACG